MIKELIHDPIFLAQKSENATIEDKQVAIDLLDTLVAHKDSCVGMAANMIGVKKRIIAFDNNGEICLCTTLKSSKRATNTTLKRVAYPFSVVLANVKDIKPSRYNIKTSNSNNESKPSLDGQLKSFNTK